MSSQNVTSGTAAGAKISAPRLFSRAGILCAASILVCLLLIWPVAEVGINDDWVYTQTALDLARTGHFMFHGWASPMLGWQAMAGALFAKLFGAGFTAMRLSMAPVAAATVLLYRAILRRFGLNAAHATFGTLVLALGPAFLPLSATFMTDVSSLFAIFVCLYLCQLAIAAETNSRAILWLVAAALSNVALGTVRQIAWLGVLVVVPCCGWILRRRAHVLQITAAVWVAGVVCIELMTRWFARQPFTSPERLISGRVTAPILVFLLAQLARAAATTLLLLLPVLSVALSARLIFRRPVMLKAAAILGVLFAALAWLHHQGTAHLLEFPWLGNTFGPHGILQDVPLFGSARAIPAAWLTLLVVIVVLCSLAAWELFRLNRSKAAEAEDLAEQEYSWRTTSTMLLPLLVSYSVLLLPRAAFFGLFDRYLLEVIAILIVFLMRWHQERVSARVPAVAVAVLVLVAALTVAGTHDLFSISRAEVRVANELQRAGVPRTEIGGGFAFDATTQVDAWGYYNDPRILNPAGAYRPQPQTAPVLRDGVYCGNPIQSYVPAVRARYVIAAGPSPCLTRTSFPLQNYRTWLPPATRELFVGVPLSAPDLSPAGQ